MGGDYELAMVNLETYYSFANIRADGGKTWTALHIPPGCYELKAINVEIIRMRGGNSDNPPKCQQALVYTECCWGKVES